MVKIPPTWKAVKIFVFQPGPPFNNGGGGSRQIFQNREEGMVGSDKGLYIPSQTVFSRITISVIMATHP